MAARLMVDKPEQLLVQEEIRRWRGPNLNLIKLTLGAACPTRTITISIT